MGHCALVSVESNVFLTAEAAAAAAVAVAVGHYALASVGSNVRVEPQEERMELQPVEHMQAVAEHKQAVAEAPFARGQEPSQKTQEEPHHDKSLADHEQPRSNFPKSQPRQSIPSCDQSIHHSSCMYWCF